MSASFTIKGSWKGNRNGQGAISTNGLQTVISAPKELDGPGVGTNPEELLISSATTCYLITLAAVLSNREIEYSHIDIESEGTVLKDGKRLVFEKIVHKPVIYIKNADEEMKEKLVQLTHRAEKACFISQTLKGNVEVSVEPVIKELG